MRLSIKALVLVGFLIAGFLLSPASRQKTRAGRAVQKGELKPEVIDKILYDNSKALYNL